MGVEFRYGNNPQFPVGTRAFPLARQQISDNADQSQVSFVLELAPSFTANATVQIYFDASETGARSRNATFYQCLDLNVTGAAPLPAWAPDFGPKEQIAYDRDPEHGGGGTRCIGPDCRPYVPNLHDWDWLIILCVLSFLVLVVAIIVACLCCRKKPPPPTHAPPEPVLPPAKEEPRDLESPNKEITPSTEPTPYVRYKFMDPNDPPSKKGMESSGSDKGTGNTGSQGRHFHFHYEEAEPEKEQAPHH